MNVRKFAPLFFHALKNIRMNREITTERRIGCHRRLPIELEKYGTKTSRGPKHFHRPPKERNGYYSNQKISSMQVCDVVICESQLRSGFSALCGDSELCQSICAMREIVLRDFFLGKAAPEELAKDVLGSVKQVGPIKYVVEIEDMEEMFPVTREMLVALCDAVLSRKFPAHELSAIGFALEASDRFTWDGEDLMGRVIDDWACPEINYPLTLENVQRFKNWLLELDPYPTKPALGPSSKRERLIIVWEKKFLPRQQQSK